MILVIYIIGFIISTLAAQALILAVVVLAVILGIAMAARAPKIRTTIRTPANTNDCIEKHMMKRSNSQFRCQESLLACRRNPIGTRYH